MNYNKRPLYIPYAGPALLETPLLNKGSAFSVEERMFFNLEGLLPEAIETIEEQEERAYQQYMMFDNDLDKHIYLRNIQDTNETLFYRLVQNHISEMMPIIYTPTVGAACENFSNIYRRGRGLFISAYTLPVVLDVGTNNPQRLSDPMYMGWRHPRVTGPEYEKFVDEFIQAVKLRWPDALIQFEDFAQKNAMPLLERYKDKVCCFNDDIQGTAAVTVGSLLAACKAAGSKLSEQRVTFLGAGSAGCGIAEAIIAQMVSEGISDEQARSQVFMVDRWGLLLDGMPNLLNFQQALVQKHHNISDWDVADNNISLLDVMRNAKPTVLIGVSGVPGLFSEEVIKEMHAHCPRPIIFPLSNPTSRVEATPFDLIRWTDGNALVATGSPFEPVVYNGKTYPIAQCNNSYIFPGIGLGVLAVNARRVTDQIAFAVAKKAVEQHKAPKKSDERIREKIEDNYWTSEYRRYKRTSF